ncbi:ABC1 kinase family protein [Roseateles violae]|uniref:AarF/UbiB family protein n=1 Tax=Roseateles violae TaxID=3058042 RepID=A0ABT8DLE1_9BURK|nr:AarF/UbiB family protein [Pelomonas sp. PFR6]MDN3918713.1 AarF/UbiB family protein [Pelomonas sp. PFR6]
MREPPPSVVRDLPRLHEISLVFMRHGLGDLMRRIGVVSVLERAGTLLRWGEVQRSHRLLPQQRLRLALEELGPTFIKLGQMLSTREDLLPPEWTEELTLLHTSVAPLPFEAMLPVIEQALGRPLAEVFVDLEREPLGSASIAQVHRARLLDGREVVLKIRRPGIEAKIEADMRLLAHLARLVESEMPEARRYQPGRVVEEFRRSILRELDLALEARNIERFGRNFRDDPHILIPQVHMAWTSSRMNVQEHIDGLSGEDHAAIARAGLDAKKLAHRGAAAVLKMILEHGFFQADPHPGNVLYLPGNRLAIIDLGMVGRLSPARRHQVIDVLAGIARRDNEPIMEVLLDWAEEDAVDEERLASDVDELVTDFADLPLKDIRVGRLLGRLTAIVREHGILLPSDLTLMFKCLVTLEGSARKYDPDFRLVDQIKPFVDRAQAARYAPAEIAQRGSASLGHFIGLLGAMPRELNRLLKDARRGRLRIDFDLKRLDVFGHRLDGAIDRITIGIMTASVVIGSSIVMTVTSGPQVFGIPLFTILGALGFLLAFFNSVWVIVWIWRSRRG